MCASYEFFPDSFPADYFPFGNNSKTSIKKWVSYLRN